MTSYVPPVKNGAGGWIGYVSLAPRTPTGTWQANPTLATGDVKVSLDGGSLANLGTLPAVTPASSKLVKITLSQAEVNADNIAIVFSDAAGAEWSDVTINLQTVATQIDDIPTVDEIQSGLSRSGDMTVVLGPNDASRSVGFKLANTNQTEVYLCPATSTSFRAKVAKLALCNVDGSSAVDVTVEWKDASAAATYKILSTWSLSADHSAACPEIVGLSLEPGDQVFLTAGAGGDLEGTITVSETGGR